MPANQENSKKRQRGRPRTHPMPDPIPDTPDNVARTLMTTKPKREDEWEYLKRKINKGKA